MKEPKEPFWRYYLIRVLPVMLVIGLLVNGVKHLGWLRPLQTSALDVLVRGSAEKLSSDISIVEITNEDYKKVFGGKSPLDVEKVEKLLGNVLLGNPAVVAVDLDTAEEEFRKLDQPRFAKVIWAHVPKEGESEELQFEPVLGGSVTDFRRTGVVRFPVDPDGVVRRYLRSFGRDMDSFPQAIRKAYRPEVHFEHNEAIFNFAGDRYKFPVIHAREFAEEPRPDAWRRALQGRIVLIGGSYSAARDEYATPKGRMAGVELVAHAIESDLSGGGIKEAPVALEMIADFLVGTSVVLLFWFLPLRPALALSLVGVPLLTIAASWLLFNSLAFWLDFVPMLLGMLVHQLYDDAERHHELLHEYHQALEKVGALEHVVHKRYGRRRHKPARSN